MTAPEGVGYCFAAKKYNFSTKEDIGYESVYCLLRLGL